MQQPSDPDVPDQIECECFEERPRGIAWRAIGDLQLAIDEAHDGDGAERDAPRGQHEEQSLKTEAGQDRALAGGDNSAANGIVRRQAEAHREFGKPSVMINERLLAVRRYRSAAAGINRAERRGV